MITRKYLKPACQLIATALLMAVVHAPLLADNQTFTSFGDLRVQHTVFNSSFIKPEIASAYNLIRGRDHALVNISVLKNSSLTSGGLPARVTGSVANLMQQTRPLAFKEIKEKNATYYLADLRFDNEEVLHFSITVDIDGRELDVRFSKKLYVE